MRKEEMSDGTVLEAHAPFFPVDLRTEAPTQAVLSFDGQLVKKYGLSPLWE